MSQDGDSISIGDAKFNINDTVNVLTAGVAGADDNGNLNWKKGWATRATDEFVGEIFGSNKAREANNIAKQQIEETKAAKKKEQEDEQFRAQHEDIQTSRSAASVRASAAAQRNNLLGTDPSKDFLGL